MIQPFRKNGAEQEFYFLGKIERTMENMYSSISHRHGTFRRIIPVFVIYDKEEKIQRDFKPDDPLWFYKKGRLTIPETRTVEGFTLRGRYEFFDLENYGAVEKITWPGGRITREREIISGRTPYDQSLLQQWDEEVLKLIKQLPRHVLDVILL